MTADEDTLSGLLVEPQPSRKELDGYGHLAGYRTAQFVLVPCTFEGKDRWAIAKLDKGGAGALLAPMAIVLNEKDIIHIRQSDGTLLPTAESELLIN
jgi:hypothetical protein